MRSPIWLSETLVLAIHDRQIAEHGGLSGIRDQGMLESALAKPQQRHAYGGIETDLTALAAAYAFGLARNHPFLDGNKRVAAVACELFLELNGYVLVADDSELYTVFNALAAGEINETQLTDWLREYARPDRVSETQSGYG